MELPKELHEKVLESIEIAMATGKIKGADGSI